MSTKRTEDYLYLQNKVRHYRNIKEIRPAVHDHLEPSLKNSIDHSILHTNNRDLPYIQQHEIEVANRHLTNRILSISERNHKQLASDGSYSRFHPFEVSFRGRNPFRDEQHRLIDVDNEIHVRKLKNASSRIGSHSHWEAEYKEKNRISKMISRYNEEKRVNAEQTIAENPYLPDPFMQVVANHKLTTSPSNPHLSLSKTKLKHVKMERQKLFILPTFLRQENIFEQGKSMPQQVG